MAIDPATAKALIMLAKKAVTDREARRKIGIALSIPLILILVILASPFAILFAASGESVEDSGTPVMEIMAGLADDLRAKIQAEENEGDADEVHVVYMGSEGEAIDNSGHVLALFSVMNSMADSEDAQQVASLSDKQVVELAELFWEMNNISVDIESIPWDSEDYPLEIPEPASVSEDDPEPEPTPTPEPYLIKTIYVTCLSYEDMLDGLNFSDDQLRVLEDMMGGDYAYLFASISGNVAELTVEEIAAIKANLPAGLSVSRESIVLTAYSLVGKVGYFWGGKSNVIGWDSRWGKSTYVSSPGSPSTGTYRPFGLDCSGYVKWVFLNSGFPLELLSESFGSGSSTQWQYSVPVDSATALPGDLAFRIVPGTGVNHVGIVVGRDSDGGLLVAHCSSSRDGVVVTAFSPTFRYLRRPVILTD